MAKDFQAVARADEIEPGTLACVRVGEVELALANGPRTGILGGVTATILFALAVRLNPHVPSTVEWESSALRLVTYVGIGWLVGWYASSKRALVEELERLARRDELTGLPNTRSFEAAIERRFRDRRPFVLLLGDVDSLGTINGRDGRDGGDPGVYERFLTAATGVRYRRDQYLSDMDAGFYSADYLRAWIRSAQLRRHLIREVGDDWWRDTRTGELLRELFREGTKPSSEEIAARIGFDPLDTKPLVDEIVA